MFDTTDVMKGFSPPPDRLKTAINKVAQKLTDDMVHFDGDIICILAVIADALCQSGQMQRDSLIATLRGIHADRQLAWTDGYSPLSLLADTLQVMAETPPATEKNASPAWLREVIEGGFSGRIDNVELQPESVD